MVRTELPHEVFLEMAAWYHNLGLDNDVTALLNLAPDQPEINYWRAWLAKNTNRSELSAELLKKANNGDPSLVFPFLLESIEPLTWAMENSVSWKPAYYLGLIHLNNNKTDKAKAMFLKCGDEPDFYPFYLVRVKLFEPSDPAASEKDLLKAASLAPEAWRAGLQLSRFYENQKNFAKAREVATAYFGKLPQNYYLGLNMAKMLNLNGDHEACVNLLANLYVLPNEGATDGQRLWRESNLVVAMDAYAAKKYKKALKFIAQLRTWPENLGVGKPYEPDERLPDFLESLCYKAIGNQTKAAGLENAIISFTQKKEYQPSGSADLISAWLLRNTGEVAKADDLIATLIKKNPGANSTRWVEAMYSGNKSMADLIGIESDTNKFSTPYETIEIDDDQKLMLKLSSIFNF
jgi:hypothetical protein